MDCKVEVLFKLPFVPYHDVTVSIEEKCLHGLKLLSNKKIVFHFRGHFSKK